MNTDDQKAQHDLDVVRHFLWATVPLWVDKLQTSSEDLLAARQVQCADVIGAEADVLVRGSKIKGSRARVMNHLAEGLAIMRLTIDRGRDAAVREENHWAIDEWIRTFGNPPESQTWPRSPRPGDKSIGQEKVSRVGQQLGFEFC